MQRVVGGSYPKCMAIKIFKKARVTQGRVSFPWAFEINLSLSLLTFQIDFVN